MGSFGLIALMLVGIGIVQYLLKGDKPQKKARVSGKFYSSEAEAMVNGKHVSMGVDDDGPGFYI